MPSSEKLKIGDAPEKFPYVATKRPLYYTERKERDAYFLRKIAMIPIDIKARTRDMEGTSS